MKRIIISLLLVIAAAGATAAQEFKPIPYPPVSRPLVESMRAAGNFKTLLSLLERAGIQDNGLRGPSGNAGIQDEGLRAGLKNLGLVPKGGKSHYQTLFAPTDAAFARMAPGALEALRKDPVRLRSFLLAHMVEGKVLVADLLTPVGDGSSRSFKELKSRQGGVLGIQCDIAHTGLHQPRINGRARVGKFQDVLASDYLLVVHEIDGVLTAGGN